MWTQRRANKYSAKRAGLAAELDLLLRAGELVRVERQKTFELRGLNGNLVARHRVDFLVTLKDGSQEVREFKGMAQEDWRIKAGTVHRQLPADSIRGHYRAAAVGKAQI